MVYLLCYWSSVVKINVAGRLLDQHLEFVVVNVTIRFKHGTDSNSKSANRKSKGKCRAHRGSLYSIMGVKVSQVLYALDTIRYSTQYAQLFKYVAYSHTLDICKRNLYPHHLRLRFWLRLSYHHKPEA